MEEPTKANRVAEPAMCMCGHTAVSHAAKGGGYAGCMAWVACLACKLRGVGTVGGHECPCRQFVPDERSVT